MSDNKKVRDTKLGKWLKEKAPNVLDTVGDLLPNQGALVLVKNLLDKEPGIDPAEAKAKVDAEIAFHIHQLHLQHLCLHLLHHQHHQLPLHMKLYY